MEDIRTFATSLPEREYLWAEQAAVQAGQTIGWILTQALRAYSSAGQPIEPPVGLVAFDDFPIAPPEPLQAEEE